jgi:4-amino-4-deoxy-L-arabinose transferase-like glycosyltransferase
MIERAARPGVAGGWAWWLAALLWFLPLNSPHLFDPDEGRYAEIPREMVVSGDWVTPRLDGLKYFEKPPLQYWATASAFLLFGQHAWTARLWSALCGFLGLLLTFGLGRRLYGARAAALAALVQASALLYIAMARIATVDMSLCVTLELALAALVLLVAADESSPPPWSCSLLLGLGVALAVLSKGLIGIVIPGATALLYMLIYRDPRLLLRARPWWSLAVLLLLTTPWMALVSLRNPEFARFFFVYQHFGRYLSRAGFDRYQPDWFFVPVLLAGLLPWTGLLPRALGQGLRAARTGERATGVLLIWSACVFVFFSLSQSKLIPYILPLFPALSLLLGRELARRSPAALRPHLTAIALGAALLCAAVLGAAQLPAAERLLSQASSSTVWAVATAFALLALAATLAMRWCRQGHVRRAVAAIAVGVLGLTQLLLFGADRLPRMQALSIAAQRLHPWVEHSQNFYCVGLYPQPLPFYLKRTCTLVGYRGELDFGLRQEPSRGIDTLQEFVRRWRADGAASAIVAPALYPQLEALGAPMRLIYTAPSLMAVVKTQ